MRLRRFVTATELPADVGYHLACHVQEKIEAFSRRLDQSMPKILTTEYSERVLYYVNETRGATLPNLWSNPVFRLLVQARAERASGNASERESRAEQVSRSEFKRVTRVASDASPSE